MNRDEHEGGPSGPHPTDSHVGLGLRIRRRQLGLTQEKLAAAVDLTFQQVQKYERGTNRVSALRPWELGRALKVGVGYLFGAWTGRPARIRRPIS